ncbi:hypothetical protein Q0M94_18890 (plasmid) [Deinococcus radiomollis]|uniref:hypothetical protein n=1 Tax=Deinococcus radiomollis TaxID=468916 RepID=UPI003892BA87
MISDRSIFVYLVTFKILFGTTFAQSSADQTLIYDPKLEITIRSANGQAVVLKGPNIILDDSGEPYYMWEILANLKSPDGRFSAIQYSGSRPKYRDGVVYIVNLYGKIIELRNSLVNKIIWTEDSKYLIGIGNGTLRVWNTNGTRRQSTPGQIVGYDYSNERVCLDVVNFREDDKLTNGVRLTLPIYSRDVYAIPTLRKISSLRTTGGSHCEFQP